jgi:hypothetical protein
MAVHEPGGATVVTSGDELILISIGDAARKTGIDPRTLHSRIRETGIVTYAPGYDRRRRLLRVEDLPRLAEARPAVPPTPRRKPRAAPHRTVVMSDAGDAWPAIAHPEAEHAEDPA